MGQKSPPKVQVLYFSNVNTLLDAVYLFGAKMTDIQIFCYDVVCHPWYKEITFSCKIMLLAILKSMGPLKSLLYHD